MIAPYDTQVTFNGWRTNPNFISAILVSLDLPPELLGDYHLASRLAGDRHRRGEQRRPTGDRTLRPTDIDGQARPQGGGFDAGADEVTGVGRRPSRSTVVRDNFNRARLGARRQLERSDAGYELERHASEPDDAGAAIASGLPARWAAVMGANQEVFFTFTDVSTRRRPSRTSSSSAAATR